VKKPVWLAMLSATLLPGCTTLEQLNAPYRYGYIDATGNMVIHAHFARARDFADGRAKVKLNTL